MATTNTAFFICAQAGVNPDGIGMPGVAKSQTIYALARATARQCYTLIGSIRDPADMGGYPYPLSNGDDRHSMSLVPPDWAVKMTQGGKWILFLDELTTCPVACQAAMLRIAAEKVVGDLELPDDTWILAACNPPEQAANGIELEPAMANRFCHLKWETPREAILRGWQSGLDFPEPTFPVVPDDWEKHLPGMGGLVAAFHQRKPGLLDSFPEDKSKQGGPWPSPRTWTYAIRCLTAAQSVNAGRSVEHTLVSGCVGEGAAVEFSTWRDQLDLPDPEQMIAQAITALEAKQDIPYTHPDRPDKVMAMLAAVNAVVLSDLTPKRWEAGMAIMEMAARYEMDVALASARPLANAVNDISGARLSAEFAHQLYPRIRRAMEN